MPLTRAEISKRYRDKQKSINPDAFKHKERLRANLNYNKIKNEHLFYNNPNIPKDGNDFKDFKDFKDGKDFNDVKDDKDFNDVKDFKDVNDVNDVNDDKDDKDVPKHLIDLNILKVDDTGFTIYKPLNKRINSLNKSILQPQTIQLYFNSFKKVFKNFTHYDMDDDFQTHLLHLLNNRPYDIHLIKNRLLFLKNDLYPFIKSLNKNDLQFVYSIFTRIKGFAPIVKSIYPFLAKNQADYQHSRNNVLLDNIDKFKYNKLSFNKFDILRILSSNDVLLTPREKLFFALFTLFPVRRPIDYYRMLLTPVQPSNEHKKYIADRSNYYFNGVFYFFRTKNKDIQIFTLPPELILIINDYILDRNSNFLFLNDHNKQFSLSLFRIHIMKVFNKIYGISFSPLELRHYYSTYINYLVKNNSISIHEHKAICNMMNHSYEENIKYAYLL